MSEIDALVGNSDVFPVLAKRDYFNHAGVSPLARPVANEVRGFLDHFQHDAFVGFDFAAPMKRLREQAAMLIHAKASDIAIVQNTSEAVSQTAFGVALQPGERVVISEAEYPANVYPWMEACRQAGAELVRVPEREGDDGVVRVREEDLLKAASHPKTQVLAVSHVQWGSGQRMDLRKLGQFCKNDGRTIFFSVDAIQSCGVVPVDVEADRIDYLQAGGHKWMLGTMGAGFLWIRPEWREESKPRVIGWANVRDALKWEEIDYTLADSAERYEYGSPAMASILALGEGLSLLNGVGIDAVHGRVKALGDRFVDGLAALPYRVVTPRDAGDPSSCGGAVCFVPDDADRAGAVYRTLATEHQTELASRCGRVRFSPHFYNTSEQVDRLLETLGTISRHGASAF